MRFPPQVDFGRLVSANRQRGALGRLNGMQLDVAGWSGDGDFTQVLVEHLRGVDEIAYLRIEDAPTSRSGADYQFVSNEIFVTFANVGLSRLRRLWPWSGGKGAGRPQMTLADLESMLSALTDVGAPDYSDEGMLQYLRTQEVVAPYQTRGYKLVELVRVYAIDPTSPASKGAAASNRH